MDENYEIAESDHDGNIVWVYGPFPCGFWPDLRIFKFKIENELQNGMKVVVDRGRHHESCITSDGVSGLEKHSHCRIHDRHEI